MKYKGFQYILIFSFACFLLLNPAPAIAQGSGFFVCEGTTCSACNFVQLANLLIDWLIGIITLLFAVLMMVAGFRLVTSGGNPSAKEAAKKSFTNAIIGFIIVLAAWVAVDTIMRTLLGEDGTVNGNLPWNEIQCATQTETNIVAYDITVPEVVRTTASGDNEDYLGVGDVNGRVSAISSSAEVTALSDAALDAMGITDPAQRKHFRALISQESSNCRNKVGPDTGKGRGRAYGCVQILVGTARDIDRNLDNRFRGLSDAQVAQILQNDDAYNIKMGALYYREGLRKYKNNIDFALARYNGGDGAMRPSKTCPGKTYYQCEANSGYAQTRHYVANIKAIARRL